MKYINAEISKQSIGIFTDEECKELEKDYVLISKNKKAYEPHEEYWI